MIKRIIAIALVFSFAGFGIWGVIRLYDNYMILERMWETPVIRPHEQPIPPMEKGVVPFTQPEALLKAAAAENLSPPYSKAGKKILESGQTGYSYYCVHCHGKNYDGMATVGQSFAPLPTDLRSPRVQNMSEGQMFHIISYGIPGGGRQPPLQATITQEQRWHIVSFVKSLDVRKHE